MTKPQAVEHDRGASVCSVAPATHQSIASGSGMFLVAAEVAIADGRVCPCCAQPDAGDGVICARCSRAYPYLRQGAA